MLVSVEWSAASWPTDKPLFLGTTPLKLLWSCITSVQQVLGQDRGWSPVEPQKSGALALGIAQRTKEPDKGKVEAVADLLDGAQEEADGASNDDRLSGDGLDDKDKNESDKEGEELWEVPDLGFALSDASLLSL
jgi:hypothetical protein